MVGGMEINPGTAEHPHRQIAAQLRAQIRRGDWGPGEKLPSIPAIAQMYGVAKQTVQRTIDALRIEGLLITKPGSGTYVRGTRRKLNRLSRGRYGSRTMPRPRTSSMPASAVGQEAIPSSMST